MTTVRPAERAMRPNNKLQSGSGSNLPYSTTDCYRDFLSVVWQSVVEIGVLIFVLVKFTMLTNIISFKICGD